MNDVKRIRYEPPLGILLSRACEAALKISAEQQCIVDFRFNGIEMSTLPYGDSVNSLMGDFHTKVFLRDESMDNTPEGRAQLASLKAVAVDNHGRCPHCGQ